MAFGKKRHSFRYSINKLIFNYKSDTVVCEVFFNFFYNSISQLLKKTIGGLVSVRDQLLMIGGRTNRVEVFEEEWNFFESNITAILNSFTTLVHNDAPYLFGGYGFFEQDYSDRVWTYNYEEKQFQVVGFMVTGRMNFRSIKGSNRLVLV